MKDNLDKDAAFPRPGSEYALAERGMSLRDYFAAKALQALLHVSAEETVRRGGRGYEDYPSQKTICEGAYNYADSMLKAREEG